MVSKIFVVAMVVCAANAAVWMGLPPEKPKEFAHKEGCYVEEINDVIPYGAEITPIGHCVRINCGRDMMDYASCGIVMAGDPNCYVTKGNLSRPYPDCCPDVECPGDNDV